MSESEPHSNDEKGTMQRAEHFQGDIAKGQSAHQLDLVAASLRQAYSSTVAEDVPDALLDLLSKLK